MEVVYLDDNQARQLFINRYLEAKKFAAGKKKQASLNAFELTAGQHVTPLSGSELIFLSQFTTATVKSENEKAIFNTHYNVPLGFLKTSQSKLKDEIPYKSGNKDFLSDNLFLAIRRGLLRCFLAAFNSREQDFKNWFSIMNNITTLPTLIYKLLPLIIESKDFPQIEMTARFAKNTKRELQFIYLGRVLGEIYFDGKTDDLHREWLMKLNPENEMNILDIPEKFKSESVWILGYILSLRFASTPEIAISELHSFLSGINGFDSAKFNEDEVIFCTFFWLGSLNEKLNYLFHTSFSADLLLSIEKKSFQLSRNETHIFDFYSEKIISDWIQNKFARLTPSSKRFTTYCEMFSGSKPEERTEAEIIEKIAPYNLLTKKVLFVFIKDDSLLLRLRNMLQQLRFIEHVLIILKYIGGHNEKESDNNLENDLIIGKIKNLFSKDFPKLTFEVISKNLSEEDDRDIINNLKGFMRKYCTESNFVYLTDSKVNSKESQVENHWLGYAFAKTPIFRKEESYLFIV